MIQTTLVILIGLAALVYLIYYVVSTYKSEDCKSGCGCDVKSEIHKLKKLQKGS